MRDYLPAKRDEAGEEMSEEVAAAYRRSRLMNDELGQEEVSRLFLC